MNKFTAQEMEEYADYVVSARLSHIDPDLEHWYTEKNKLTKKVIDLSLLVKSQIDCEFSDEGDTSWSVGMLSNIHARGEYSYTCEQFHEWVYCRPRMLRRNAWQGGKCPLPEGFLIALQFRGDSYMITTNYIDINWTHEGEALDIIAFEVLGLADGYVMPWEGE